MTEKPAHKRQLARIKRQFESHATALGTACIAWSSLESEVDDFLSLLIPLGRGETEMVVTSNIDFRAKLQILLLLGFKEKYSDTWFLELQTVVNLIDNQLRTERNRYVHDTWRFTLGKTNLTASRTTKGAKLRKPQPFELELVTETETPIDLEELRSLATRISKATWELRALNLDLEKAQDDDYHDRRPWPDSRRDPQLEQYLRRLQENEDQQERIGAKRQPPPQPFRK